MRVRCRADQALALLLVLVLAAGLLAPVAAIVRAGFIEDGRFSLAWFHDVLGDLGRALIERGAGLQALAWDPSAENLRRVLEGGGGNAYGDGLINSVVMATLVTALCALLALPLALLAESYRFAGRRAWLALVLVPMILPPFVGALGLKALLARHGGVNALLAGWGWIDPARPIDWLAYPFWSCVVIEAISLYPLMFLNVQAALASIDPALEDAARNLGAGPWRRFRRVTLPLLRPGVFAGGTLIFVWSLTELGTPLMVGFRRLTAVQVFDELQKTNPAGDAYALVVVLLLLSVGLYAIGKVLLGRPTGGMLAKATVAAQPPRLGPVGSLLVTLPFAIVFTLAVLPHAGVLLMSLSGTGMLEFSPENWTAQHHRDLLSYTADASAPGDGLAARSVVNSFRYSLLATALDLVLGLAIAYLVVRRRNAITATLDALAMLPLAVPGLVLAFGYFALTQGDTPLARLNPLAHDPTPLLVIAYAVRRLPFLVRACAAGLEQASEALEEAAINLGASRLRTMWTIVVPLLAANLIAGGLIVFSRSMLEVSDSLILAFDQHTYPVAKAIWALAAIPRSGIETASALGAWGMLILIATIALASLALGRRLGALFRA